jgi:hypothetical protein
VVTDVTDDHASKNQEAHHIRPLVCGSIMWLFEPPSGLEHVDLDRIPLSYGTRLFLGVLASPHPAFGTPLRAGEGGNGVRE